MDLTWTPLQSALSQSAHFRTPCNTLHISCIFIMLPSAFQTNKNIQSLFRIQCPCERCIRTYDDMDSQGDPDNARSRPCPILASGRVSIVSYTVKERWWLKCQSHELLISNTENHLCRHLVWKWPVSSTHVDNHGPSLGALIQNYVVISNRGSPRSALPGFQAVFAGPYPVIVGNSHDSDHTLGMNRKFSGYVRYFQVYSVCGRPTPKNP